jgi:glycosyltransferase involved in cell wall biosynthesis
MPCLNEERTLAKCIQKAKSFIAKNQIEAEIIIADNNSTDHSVEIAQNLGVKVIVERKKGYGNVLKAGITYAQGKYIIIGDADDSYDFEHLELFLGLLTEGYDMVIGNRFQGGIAIDAMPFLHRYLGNPILSFIGKFLFNIKGINDFHCGLRGFSKQMIILLDLQATGMEFASEMIVKASLLELKIIEIPTYLSKDGRNAPSHLHKWRDGWRHLRLMLILFFQNSLINLYQSKSKNERIERLANQISTLLKPYIHNEKLKFLDVGCGNMQLSERIALQFPTSYWTCTDVFENIPFFMLLQEGKCIVNAKKWEKYKTFNGKELPFEDNSFEVVFLIDVLHHCPEDAVALLKEAKRVGRIIVIKDHFEYGNYSRQILRLMDWYGNLGKGIYIPKKYFTKYSFTVICNEIGFSEMETKIGLDLYSYSLIMKLLLRKEWQFISIIKNEV